MLSCSAHGTQLDDIFSFEYSSNDYDDKTVRIRTKLLMISIAFPPTKLRIFGTVRKGLADLFRILMPYSKWMLVFVVGTELLPTMLFFVNEMIFVTR